MGGSQSSALADAVNTVSKLPLSELSSSVLAALYTHQEDIWSAVAVDTVRSLKKLPDGPARLIALLRHLQLNLTSFAQLPAISHTQCVHARNCCYLIARICPVVFEGCSVEQVDEMFWLPSASAEPPLGRALVDVCLELMFLPQFCCSSTCQIWSQGLGSFVPKPQIVDPAFNGNRHAVVLALLGICSLPLFISTSELTAKGNRFVSSIVCVDTIMAQLVFRSLLNVVLCYDVVGWGLPFGGLVSAGATSESFVSSCCQLLLILLDTNEDVLQLHAATSSHAAAAVADGAPRSLNMVLNDLTDICDPRDFEFMFNSILTLLTNPLMASSSSIPGAVTSISFFQEAIILLWTLLSRHSGFAPFILRTFDVAQLVIPLVFFINEGRKDSAKTGLVHICTFVLLLLSGERNFSIALNAPFNVQLPTDLPAFSGCVGDLLVIVLSRLVLEHTVQMLPLFDCFFTIIGNISAYIKSFCMGSAVRLLQLFSVFSRRKILCSSGGNHRYLLLILEAINNIIQYQYEGNPSILLQIISKAKDFEALQSLGGDAAPSPRASLDSQQAEAASAAAASAISAAASSPANQLGDAADIPPFEPTDEWLAALRDRLPLEPSLRVLHHLQPHVLRFCDERGVRDEASVVAFLKSTTMVSLRLSPPRLPPRVTAAQVGLLPVPHPILVRKYHSNSNTQNWLTTYIWGIIYLRNQDPLLFDSSCVRLFKISFAD